LIPNSQKISPSEDEIRMECLRFQRGWDEETEERRRVGVYKGRVTCRVVSTSGLPDSCRWIAEGDDYGDSDL
jgi:hypothetical protein